MIPHLQPKKHYLNKDCLSCHHPICLQRTTTSNAYSVCDRYSIQSTKEIEREVLDRKFGDLVNRQSKGCESCKKYIITEEQVKEWENDLLAIDGEWGIGTGIGTDYHTSTQVETIKIILSCPYDPQAEREKLLNKFCKICPHLDERPETCEDCVVETVRKELRQKEE